MIVAVQASNRFDEYAIFLRAMGTALASMKEDDNQYLIYSAGPAKLNSMVAEFSNVSERSLKARGIRIRFFKVPSYWVKDNLEDIDYFAYFSKPKENVSDLVRAADAKDVEVGVYRY